VKKKWVLRIAEYGVDLDGQRIDPDWLKGELSAWMARGGYITEMFNKENVVARCLEVSEDERGLLGVISHVDDYAAGKLADGIYKGLGVGIKDAHVVKDDLAPNGVINGGTVTDVSLLDEPMRYVA
jgi:hypothetical protein